MTGPVVASAAVEIVPSAEGFFPKLRADLAPQATKLGQDISDEISRPIAEKLRDAIGAGLTTDGAGKGGSTGDQFGDAFSRAVKAKLEAAFKTLPTADLKADSSDVDRKLAEIKATLLGLNDQAYIDLHVDDETTLATIAALKAELDDLTTPDHDIRVRVDAAAAAAELAALQAQIDKLNRSGNPPGGGGIGDLGGAAENASGGFYQFLIPAIAALSTIIGPVVATGVAGLGTILLGAKGVEAEVKTGLTPAFKQLQETAVEALQPGIAAAVSQLKLALPQLTPLVQVFGSAIGDAADQLASWLNNGGLTGFVDYATQELPIVENAFKGLAAATIGFFQDVTPIGNDILHTVTAISDGVAKAEALFAKFQGSSGGAGTLPNGSPASGTGAFVQVNSNESILHQTEGIFRNIATSFVNPGNPVTATFGTNTDQKQAKAAKQFANQFGANQSTAATRAGTFNFGNVDPVSAASLGGSIHDVVNGLGSLTSSSLATAAANQIAALTQQFSNANPAVLGLVSALNTFSTSEGTALDKGKLLSAVLVASQGDALSYSAAVAAGYGADSALVQAFQSQASQLAQQSASASASDTTNTAANGVAKDKSAAANERLTASEDKLASVRKNAKATSAQILSAEASVSSARATAATSTAALGKTAQATASAAGLAFADTELGAINLKTGLINLTAQGAGPLITQFQSMQTAASNAAAALYEHEVSTKGDSAALQDAQDLFESMTGGTLVANAKQLGITAGEAKKLANNYFAVPKNLTTQVQSIGLNDVNNTLTQIGQLLAGITGQTWVINFGTNLTDDSTTLGGKSLAQVVNDLGATKPVTGPKYVAPKGKPIAAHWGGGLIADGLFSTGEHGIEYGYKSGPNVMMLGGGVSPFNPGTLSAGSAVASSHPSGPQVMQNHITLQVGERVLARTVNEVNLFDKNRRN